MGTLVSIWIGNIECGIKLAAQLVRIRRFIRPLEGQQTLHRLSPFLYHPLIVGFVYSAPDGIGCRCLVARGEFPDLRPVLITQPQLEPLTHVRTSLSVH